MFGKGINIPDKPLPQKTIEGYPIVNLEVRTRNGQLACFEEKLMDFPSKALIAKIMLVA